MMYIISGSISPYIQNETHDYHHKAHHMINSSHDQLKNDLKPDCYKTLYIFFWLGRTNLLLYKSCK